jgi:AraC-like DNA-binding protein
MEFEALSFSRWLSSFERLLQDDPPVLTTLEAVVMQASLTRVMLRVSRRGTITAVGVVQMIDAVTGVSETSEVLRAARDRVSLVATQSLQKDELTGKHPEERIVRALEYIDQKYHDSNVSLSTVAAQVKLSSWYLSRLLRRDTGHTFEFYLHRRRVQRAQVLLHEPTLSVKEISYLVGYRSTTQLDRHFKRICDITPKVYRRLLALS